MSLIRVKATLIESILGTLSSDKELYKTYIASKAPDAMTMEEEVATFGEDEMYNKGMTIFKRDKDGLPFIYNYLIKGFFKNACSAMREVPKSKSSKLTSYRKKIDNRVFVWPREIGIYIDGERATNDNITICERPLRASTPQGERVAISVSEELPAGSTIEFEVETLGADLDNAVLEWLEYGKYNGLGQWHNSGKGSFTFTYEVLRDDTPSGDETKEEATPKKRGRKKKEAVATDDTTDTTDK